MKRWIIGFFILQIGVDLAHSVTAFPFVHYGMFSETFARPDSVEVFEVSVDGKRLRPADYTIYQWDMVQVPLQACEKRIETDDYTVDKEKLRAGMERVGLTSIYNNLKINLNNTNSFFPWYGDYLGRLLGMPVGTVRVNRAWYRWTRGRLVLIRTENWLNG